MPASNLPEALFVAAALICTAIVHAPAFAADNPPWQDGRVTNVENLDATRSDNSDPECTSLQAQIYTVETDKQVLKMLGNMGAAFNSGEQRSVRFYVDKDKRAHILRPDGRVHRTTLIVYEREWKHPPSNQPVSSSKRKSRSWLQAKVKAVEPFLVRVPAAGPYGPYYGRACFVSRPVGWIYAVELDGITYDAVWKKQTPLDLRAKEEASVAWKGTGKIYLIDDDGNERTLPLKERRQPPLERSGRASSPASK